MPDIKTKLPGGAYRWKGGINDSDQSMGSRTGVATRKSGMSGVLGKISSTISGDSDDQLRAMTPQEVQQRTSEVDADDLKNQTKGVAGAMPSYKKGGIVSKTGLAKLHKGEKVISKNNVKRTEKAVKKYAGKR